MDNQPPSGGHGARFLFMLCSPTNSISMCWDVVMTMLFSALRWLQWINKQQRRGLFPPVSFAPPLHHPIVLLNCHFIQTRDYQFQFKVGVYPWLENNICHLLTISGWPQDLERVRSYQTLAARGRKTRGRDSSGQKSLPLLVIHSRLLLCCQKQLSHINITPGFGASQTGSNQIEGRAQYIKMLSDWSISCRYDQQKVLSLSMCQSSLFFFPAVWGAHIWPPRKVALLSVYFSSA